MEKHVVVCLNSARIPLTDKCGSSRHGEGNSVDNASGSSPALGISTDSKLEELVISEEERPLLQLGECRICQDEDHVKNLESPCACSGSLKYAHRKCLQRWCNEKGDVICEICHQKYQPGYTAPPRPNPEETIIDIENWAFSGALDLHDPRLLAMAAADQHFLESDYEDDANTSGAAFCGSAVLVLMALLLLRHALTITNPDGDEDASTFFSLFLLRAAAFLLPCYIMAWAFSILQSRHQRQEAAALAATEVAFMLQAGEARGIQFTVAPAAAIAAGEPFQ